MDVRRFNRFSCSRDLKFNAHWGSTVDSLSEMCKVDRMLHVLLLFTCSIAVRRGGHISQNKFVMDISAQTELFWRPGSAEIPKSTAIAREREFKSTRSGVRFMSQLRQIAALEFVSSAQGARSIFVLARQSTAAFITKPSILLHLVMSPLEPPFSRSGNFDRDAYLAYKPCQYRS